MASQNSTLSVTRPLPKIIGEPGLEEEEEEDENSIAQFSGSELATLRAVWPQIIQTQTDGNFGAKLFIRLFEHHPRYLSLFGFPHDQRQLPESFRTGAKLAAHGANVTYMLGMLFDQLDDAELLDELLGKLVVSHAKRGIEPQWFDHIIEPFHETITQMAKEAATTTTETSVSAIATIVKAFRFVTRRLQQLYDELDLEQLLEDDEDEEEEEEAGDAEENSSYLKM